jgi:hypothetical protein
VEQKRKTLLEIGQYYLDNINPSLNICKKADSFLEVKRDIMFSINLSKSQIGKSIKLNARVKNTGNKPKIIANENRLKISPICKDVGVKVFYKSNNLIKEFPIITSAALHFGVDTSTISRIYKKGITYDSYIYKFQIIDLRV